MQGLRLRHMPRVRRVVVVRAVGTGIGAHRRTPCLLLLLWGRGRGSLHGIGCAHAVGGDGELAAAAVRARCRLHRLVTLHAVLVLVLVVVP